MALAGLVLARFIVVAPAITAQEAWNLATIHIDGDLFRSYDFRSNAHSSATNADWPVTAIYKDNAEVDKVKSGLGGGCSVATCGGMYARVAENSSWSWDSDLGRKVHSGHSVCSGIHTRVYAPDDRFNNPSWGYFVIATAHHDVNDCPPFRNTWYGWSEAAQNQWDTPRTGQCMQTTSFWGIMRRLGVWASIPDFR
jgi:hypothetical protein